MENLAELPISAFIAAVLIVAVAVGMLFARLRAALWVVAAMFFAGSVGVTAVVAGGSPVKLWIWPITYNRSAIFAVCGGLLVITMLTHAGEVLRGRRLPQGLMLLAIGLYAGLLRVVHDGPASGVASMALAVITIGPLLYVLPALLRSFDHFMQIFRVLGWTNLVWIAVVAVQFIVDPNDLTKGAGNRLYGLTGNAQHAAAYLATMATITLWLFLNDPRRKLRWYWLALVGLNVVMLLWTGSRTGVGMLTLGFTAIFFARFGRMILLLPLVMLVVWGAFEALLALGVDLSMTERLTSTEDTRSRAWATLVEVGLENPLFGAGIEGAGESENSYLQGFAAYGLGMVGIILAFMGVTAVMLLRLVRLRRWGTAGEKALIDLIIGYNAMYFGASVFEGIMMARVNAHIVILLIMASIATQLHPYFAEQAELAEDDGSDPNEGETLAGYAEGYEGYGYEDYPEPAG